MAKTRTKAERVYELMRADILAGRLPPGSRLRYADLAARYGTSTGALREAMLRLSEQGLVKGEPQLGSYVAELSVDDLRELTDARIVLEGLVLRAAIADGDLEWESRLLASHHRLSRTSEHDPADHDRLSDEWVAAHAAFHRALLDGCTNGRLKEIASSLRDAAELYRRWSVPLGNSPDRNVKSEHDELLAAALARDAERAVESLAAHILLTSSTLFETYADTSSRPS